MQEHIKSVNNGFWKTAEGLKLRQELAKYLGHEVVYSRDDNGNITHIDGVPIEEKYKVINNRHWILSSGEITSNQQRAIRNDGIPVNGPRGYLYDDCGDITHVDGISIEEIYKSIENKLINIDNSFFCFDWQESK